MSSTAPYGHAEHDSYDVEICGRCGHKRINDKNAKDHKYGVCPYLRCDCGAETSSGTNPGFVSAWRKAQTPAEWRHVLPDRNSMRE